MSFLRLWGVFSHQCTWIYWFHGLCVACHTSRNQSYPWGSMLQPFLSHSTHALPWQGIHSYFSNVPTDLFQIFAMSQISFFVIHSWRRFSTGKERYSSAASNKHELSPWFKKKKKVWLWNKPSNASSEHLKQSVTEWEIVRAVTQSNRTHTCQNIDYLFNESCINTFSSDCLVMAAFS